MFQVEVSAIWLCACMARVLRWLQVFGQVFRAEVWGELWRRRLKIGALVGLICTLWAFIYEGTREGNAPLPSWMMLAETAVFIMGLLAVQRFSELVRQQVGMRIDPTGARGKIASLLVQLFFILVGNTAVIVLMWRAGILFTFSDGDWLNVIVAGVALSPLPVIWTLLRVGVQWRWLQNFHWNDPWTKCWYVLALKVFPQFTQTYVVATGEGSVPFWGMVGLTVLGYSRLHEAWGDWRQNPTATTARALRATMVADFFSVSCLMIATAYAVLA